MESHILADNGDDNLTMEIKPRLNRYPCCIVWTPIPMLTWLFPLIGHMGIATTKGIIRDFAGSYYVGEDNMGFGWPTRYWQLDLNNVNGSAEVWDRAVQDAADEYKTHAHNLFCDNCHSFVAMALNKMKYKGKDSYNMVYLASAMALKGRYVGVSGFLKQWVPFLLIIGMVMALLLCFRWKQL